MITLLIKNGVVEKGIVATKEEAEAAFPDYICIESDVAGVGWTYADGVFTPPEFEPEPIPVILGVLCIDVWSIPADGETFATVTYTSNETVYFAVESEIHTVEPADQVATLEITADAPGPVRVDVKDKRIVIAALEVV